MIAHASLPKNQNIKQKQCCKKKKKVNKNLKKFHIEKIFFKKAGNRAVGEGKGTPDWEGGVQEFWMKDVVQVVPGYVCRGRFSVILCKRK